MCLYVYYIHGFLLCFAGAVWGFVHSSVPWKWWAHSSVTTGGGRGRVIGKGGSDREREMICAQTGADSAWNEDRQDGGSISDFGGGGEGWKM